MGFYDEIEIEDMTWDETNGVFHYPCPCGDRFEISRKQLGNGEDVATCPSCSLVIRIVYDYLDFEEDGDDEGEEAEEEGEEEDDSDDEKFEEAVETLNVDLSSRLVVTEA